MVENSINLNYNNMVSILLKIGLSMALFGLVSSFKEIINNQRQINRKRNK